ncbi:MAG: putative nucleic acid-binding protein contains domain [Actinomycetia bacterium]|nr:putative nucleic acid-binding protein contains domain [Actinomycetes bacterium]
MTAWYLDSSAIVKFAVEEVESAALARWRAALPDDVSLVTCELSVTEVLRAVGRVGGDLDVAMAHLDALGQVVVDRELLLAAAQLQPPTFRSLDAIHLAAAAAFGSDLAGLVTYDDRMAGAARGLGLAPMAPGTEP